MFSLAFQLYRFQKFGIVFIAYSLNTGRGIQNIGEILNASFTDANLDDCHFSEVVESFISINMKIRLSVRGFL